MKVFIKRQYLKINTDFENADTLYIINFVNKNIGIFIKNSVFYI
jgi:hypothetical protein